MNLLYEPPELPASAWSVVRVPAVELDRTRWPDAWIDEQLAAAGANVRRVSAQTTTTARGWPLELATYEADGQLLVIATYAFFDLVAGIAIGGLTEPWLRDHDLEVAAALRAVELEWISDEPLTLRELWA